jgi:hypothetical protein
VSTTRAKVQQGGNDVTHVTLVTTAAPLIKPRPSDSRASDYGPGSFPRGNPEALFVEPDEIEAGPGLLRGLFASQPAWRRQALCGDHDLGIFYPAKGGSNKPGLAVCAACPVRHPCLAEALDDSSLDWGIRGGMTALARVAARKAQVTNDTERAA